MGDSDNNLELDFDGDHQAILPDGQESQDSILTLEEKYASQKRILDARRAVDQWHEDQKLVKDLQNADIFLKYNKAELLNQIR